MTIAECYSKLNGDYQDMLERVGTDSLVERFLLKYPNEKSMMTLREAVESRNIEASFNAAHTLKGVAANLSLTGLVQAASELTEQLRPKTEVADAELMTRVEEQYKLVIDTINEYVALK